jgi:DNA polymerase elongation subunit (family B)
MQYNISPETLIDGPAFFIDTLVGPKTSNLVSGLLDQKIDTSDLKTHNACLTANRQFFRTDVSGFLPKIMQRMYDDRKKYKKDMLKAKAAKVKAKSKAEEIKLEKDVSKFENLQKSKKIQLNSAYGALGNEYF